MSDKEIIKIKKNEYGFLEDVALKCPEDVNIVCLTGVNGAGKSKILEKIRDSNQKVCIYTTTNLNTTTEDEYNRYFIGGRFRRDKITSVDDFLDDIPHYEGIGVTEIKNILFADNYPNTEKRKEMIKSICKRIGRLTNHEVEKRFLNRFLIPTEADIKNAEIELHKEHYKQEKENKGVTRPQYHIDSQEYSRNMWLKEQEENNEEQEENNEEQEKNNGIAFKENVTTTAINTIKNQKDFTWFTGKTPDEAFNVFTEKLKDEVFNSIQIERLVNEITRLINQDFRANQNKKKPIFLYATINNDINNEFNNQEKDKELYNAFPYNIVPPNPSLEGYTLEFKYNEFCTNLQKSGSITFNQLSTGEKNIFALLIYKYLLTEAETKGHYEYLLLDEFDANMHPAFTKFYIDTIKYIAKNNKKITIIFTTHSYVTLSAANKYLTPNQYKLYQVIKEILPKKQHVIKLINTTDDFNDFLDKYSASILPEILNDADKLKQADYIIITEGEQDNKYISDYIKYKKPENKDKYYVQSHVEKRRGHNAIAERINAISNEHYKNKTLVGLFDCDKAWGSYKEAMDGAYNTNLFHKEEVIHNNKTDNVYKLFIVHKPITKEDFNEQCNDLKLEYPYTNTVEEYVKSPTKAAKDKVKGYAIEDLIVSYNIQQYNEYLKTSNNLSIESFFNNTQCHKDNVEKFFNNCKENNFKDFNFTGFDLLFNSIENQEDKR